MKKIEEKTEIGVYGFPYTTVIIETPTGRMVVRQGFGGIDTPHGGAYRWRHGVAAMILPNDTLQSLSGDWTASTSHLEAILSGYDPERPVVDRLPKGLGTKKNKKKENTHGIYSNFRMRLVFIIVK